MAEKEQVIIMATPETNHAEEGTLNELKPYSKEEENIGNDASYPGSPEDEEEFEFTFGKFMAMMVSVLNA